MRVGATSWRITPPDGSIALDDAEAAECIADSIETQCSHASHDTAHISRIEEEVLQKTSLEPQDDLTPVSLSEVQLLVRSLKTRKAPGLDGVTWKEAEVIGIHKPGNRATPASYRPISLLSGLAKYSRVLKTRLSKHLFGKGLIIDEQFGFARPLMHEGTHSTRRLIRAGVPQGSALSPLLYSAYTNDIPRPTSGVQLALFADDTALFYKSKNRSSLSTFLRLQRAIDELGQWFRLWKIEVNPEKSAAIQFKYSKHRSKFVVDWNTPSLKMLNARIPWQRSYKYLGVTLDKNLHFREHIARVRKNALFYTARLGAMLGRKSKLSRRNKLTLYKMCIRTVLTYASPVFAHAALKALYRLQVIQNKFCRAATDAHWCVRNSILHRDLELPTLSKYMKDASKRFFDIAGSHPNALL
ncbi:Probable RNA-directed DNA polymerase from transposon BS [Eumeta japonica]|uniref:Probable RNA-directed DNA polymerase from transposon BS n=1 Tax=Eumeta variegata TaxID=151549 RepID=A0A4C1WU31_EUMVA|nr:Probable RNA-directed DNA polymerase from transposon BS [Eumeta japonica]